MFLPLTCIYISRDRRSLGAHAKPAGVLVGHTEGITYVSPKGDGRYVISNGKDQTMRLWDLRKMASGEEHEAMPRRRYGLGQGWDYRHVTVSLVHLRSTLISDYFIFAGAGHITHQEWISTLQTAVL